MVTPFRRLRSSTDSPSSPSSDLTAHPNPDDAHMVELMARHALELEMLQSKLVAAKSGAGHGEEEGTDNRPADPLEPDGRC